MGVAASPVGKGGGVHGQISSAASTYIYELVSYAQSSTTTCLMMKPRSGMTWMDVVQRVAAATQGGARAAAAGRSAGARSLRIRLGEAVTCVVDKNGDVQQHPTRRRRSCDG